jgi:hypothetical protein
MLFRNISRVTRKDQRKSKKPIAGNTIVTMAKTHGSGSSNIAERKMRPSIMLRLLSKFSSIHTKAQNMPGEHSVTGCFPRRLLYEDNPFPGGAFCGFEKEAARNS